LRMSWGGSKAERTLIVRAIDADMAKTSACEACFVVKPVSLIYQEVEFSIKPSLS
jgi:hypothetical protein